MKKIFFFILTILSLQGFSQSKLYLRGDSVYIQSAVNGELILLNSSRLNTGAYLKNTGNGRTGFAYVLDSVWVDGDSVRFRYGPTTISHAIGGSNPSLQNVTDVGATTTNNLTTGLITWRYSGTNIGNLTAVISGSNYGGALALKDYSTSFYTTLYPQSGLSASHAVYHPKTGNLTDTLFTFHDWRTLGGGTGGSGSWDGSISKTKVSNASTYTLSLDTSFYVFNGSSISNWTIPALSGVTGKKTFTIKNNGTEVLNILPTGSDEFFTTSDVSTVGIAVGKTMSFINLDGYWTAYNYYDSPFISEILGLQGELDSKAPLASPALTGTPTATTATTGNNSTRIATTAFVQQELAATANYSILQGLTDASTITLDYSVKGDWDSVVITDSRILNITNTPGGDTAWSIVIKVIHGADSLTLDVPGMRAKRDSFSVDSGAIDVVTIWKMGVDTFYSIQNFEPPVAEPPAPPETITENWDGVTPPAIPSNWTGTNVQTAAFSTITSPNVLRATATTASCGYDVTQPANTSIKANAKKNSASPVLIAYVRCTNVNFFAGGVDAYYCVANGSTGNFTLNKMVGGTDPGALGTVAGFDGADYYDLQLSAVGTTISLKVQRNSDGQYLKPDGSWQVASINAISVTDGSVTAAGKSGVAFVDSETGPTVGLFDRVELN